MGTKPSNKAELLWTKSSNTSSWKARGISTGSISNWFQLESGPTVKDLPRRNLPYDSPHSQVDGTSATIATAVEEQSASTNEMARKVADAAKGDPPISPATLQAAGAAQGASNRSQELKNRPTILPQWPPNFEVWSNNSKSRAGKPM